MKSKATARKAAGNLNRAARNLGQSAKLAKAAGDVIVARTRLAARGDYAEVTRMVPEKIAAFSAANIACARHAAGAAAQIMQHASQEWRALQVNAEKISRARTPAEAAFIQCAGVLAWWGRFAAEAGAIGARMMQAQYAATAPIARTARANVSRLSR